LELRRVLFGSEFAPRARTTPTGGSPSEEARPSASSSRPSASAWGAARSQEVEQLGAGERPGSRRAGCSAAAPARLRRRVLGAQRGAEAVEPRAEQIGRAHV